MNGATKGESRVIGVEGPCTAQRLDDNGLEMFSPMLASMNCF